MAALVGDGEFDGVGRGMGSLDLFAYGPDLAAGTTGARAPPAGC
jgi:hypothetical protein